MRRFLLFVVLSASWNLANVSSRNVFSVRLWSHDVRQTLGYTITRSSRIKRQESWNSSCLINSLVESGKAAMNLLFSWIHLIEHFQYLKVKSLNIHYQYNIMSSRKCTPNNQKLIKQSFILLRKPKPEPKKLPTMER